MFFSKPTVSAVLLLISSSVLAAPAEIARRQPGEEYDCGCASRKATLKGQGANNFDLAVTLLETSEKMAGTTDVYAYGDYKQDDSANFGLFKNNWFAIRTACSQFAGQPVENWNNGAVLNDDDAAAIKCQHEQREYFGDKWFAVQRNAESGLNSPDTDDIKQYRTAVAFVEDFINQGHSSDNKATYYTLGAI
ncbi:MAG: hypothetical protein M1837_004541 [Sclerophora amabilis]|nr:MAG: hypothetical protein M1837_004541 [Sclerophora amabilis]